MLPPDWLMENQLVEDVMGNRHFSRDILGNLQTVREGGDFVADFSDRGGRGSFTEENGEGVWDFLRVFCSLRETRERSSGEITEKSHRGRRKERYDYHGSLVFLYRYIVSFPFLNSISGLLDYMFSFMVHVWAMGLLLLSPSLLWLALRATQLCFSFTMHHVGVLFCFHFYEVHSSSLTYS